MKRIMLLPSGAPPLGWEAIRDEDRFVETMQADEGEVEAVAIMGTPDGCARMMEATADAANRQFHLFSGMLRLKAIHFHDPDVSHAEACRGHALDLHKDHITPASDTHVPLGNDAVWMRDAGRIVVPGHALPETVMDASAGLPVSRLVSSPMLPEDILAAGFERHPRDLVIITSKPGAA